MGEGRQVTKTSTLSACASWGWQYLGQGLSNAREKFTFGVHVFQFNNHLLNMQHLNCLSHQPRGRVKITNNPFYHYWGEKKDDKTWCEHKKQRKLGGKIRRNIASKKETVVEVGAQRVEAKKLRHTQNTEI